MKCLHFSKKTVAIQFLSVLLLLLSSCSQNSGASIVPSSSGSSSIVLDSSQTPSEKSLQPSPGSGAAENQTSSTKSSAQTYTMSVYTEAPNKNSSIKIQYPSFSGNGFDALNALIYNKVQSFAKIDTSLFSGNTGLTIDYQSAVTLQNSKIVSIVFWGSSYIEGGAYPVSNLITLNIDLQSLKEITFKDLYTTNAGFEKVFFNKAFFPENPITSYDKASFPEMLWLQSPEYQTVDPFSIPDNVSCFLKPDGIVLSMPAVHATGSDHFEAQLKYSDIQQFYLLGQNYWENK
ncbi:MAG: hypothetical protein LBS02_08980 [Hungatella sp.]|jgi:hypothetical protein|nr:hypothetical protein [Hungatella sp.]